MRKQIFSLILLGLVCSIGNAWGENFTISPLTKNANSYCGLISVTIGDNTSISSSQIQVTKNKVGSFTISVNEPNLYIVSASFTDKNSGKIAAFTCENGKGSLGSSSPYSFTASGNPTSVSFTLSAEGKNGNAKLGDISVVVSNGSTNNIETLTSFTKPSNFSFTSKINDNAVTSAVTISGTSTASSNNVSFASDGTLIFTSTKNIRFVALVEKDLNSLSSVSASTGSWNGYWSGNAKTVTFTNNTSSSRTISKIFIVTTPCPSINTQPESSEYLIGDVPSNLTVAATASEGSLSYQWYSCSSDKSSESALSSAEEIAKGAQSNSYTPSIASAGTSYYFCRVTDENGYTDTEIATISVSATAIPSFLPASGTLKQNAGLITISSETEGSTIFFKWSGSSTKESFNYATYAEDGWSAGATGEATATATAPNETGTFYLNATTYKEGENSPVVNQGFSIDGTAPTFTTSPANEATSVARDAAVTFTANESISKVGENINGTIKVGSAEPTAITFSIEGNVLTFSHSHFAFSTTYVVTLSANQVQDAVGNQNATTSFSFTTGEARSGKTLTQAKYSNGFFGEITQPSGDKPGSIAVYYLINESAPSLSDVIVSDGATYEVVGNELTVTAEDESTSVYNINFTSVVPYSGNDSRDFVQNDISWVRAPYNAGTISTTSGKLGWKMIQPSTEERIYSGQTRVTLFLAAGSSITLTTGSSNNRVINVYVNSDKVKKDYSLTASTGTVAVTGDEENPYIVVIEQSTTGGDAAVKSFSITKSGFESGIISEIGWNSFASSSKLDLSDMTGGTAYAVSEVSASTASLTEFGNVVVASGTGMLINGTPYAAYKISTSTSAVTFSETNKLVGTTSAITGDVLTALSNPYVLGKVDEEAALCKFTGTTIPANKAYLPSSEVPAGAPGIRFIIGENNNATNLQKVETNEITVKFIENGQLLIKRDGIVYDALGRVVR